MKAIEINTKTDSLGCININYQLKSCHRNVRVLILLDDKKSDLNEEKLWLKSISANQSFDFLKEKGEDVYSINDGIVWKY